MRIILSALLILVCSSIGYSQLLVPANTMNKIWETGDGIKVPESVLVFDSILFVSNIDGNPAVKDGTGCISIIDRKGKMLQEEWVKGIDAPKGMAILGNHLFVSNIDEVVEIEIQTASIIKRHAIKDAQFLNDIAIDTATGMIFITDTKTGTVSVLRNGISSTWLEGSLFKGANGLFLKGNHLFIGAANSILQADIISGEVRVILSGTGAVDGLYVTDDDKFIYSNFKGLVYIAGRKGKPEELLNTISMRANTADFAVIASENKIIIPTFAYNRIICYSSALIK